MHTRCVVHERGTFEINLTNKDLVDGREWLVRVSIVHDWPRCIRLVLDRAGWRRSLVPVPELVRPSGTAKIRREIPGTMFIIWN